MSYRRIINNSCGGTHAPHVKLRNIVSPWSRDIFKNFGRRTHAVLAGTSWTYIMVALIYIFPWSHKARITMTGPSLSSHRASFIRGVTYG